MDSNVQISAELHHDGIRSDVFKFNVEAVKDLKTAIRRMKRLITKCQATGGLTDDQWSLLAEAQKIGKDALKKIT